MDLNIQKWFEVQGVRISIFAEITNIWTTEVQSLLIQLRVKVIKYPRDPAALIALRSDRSYDVR